MASEQDRMRTPEGRIFTIPARRGARLYHAEHRIQKIAAGEPPFLQEQIDKLCAILQASVEQ